MSLGKLVAREAACPSFSPAPCPQPALRTQSLAGATCRLHRGSYSDHHGFQEPRPDFQAHLASHQATRRSWHLPPCHRFLAGTFGKEGPKDHLDGAPIAGLRAEAREPSESPESGPAQNIPLGVKALTETPRCSSGLPRFPVVTQRKYLFPNDYGNSGASLDTKGVIRGEGQCPGVGDLL